MAFKLIQKGGVTQTVSENELHRYLKAGYKVVDNSPVVSQEGEPALSTNASTDAGKNDADAKLIAKINKTKSVDALQKIAGAQDNSPAVLEAISNHMNKLMEDDAKEQASAENKSEG